MEDPGEDNSSSVKMRVTVASLQGDVRYTITTLCGCEREEEQHYFWLLHPFIYSFIQF